MYTFTTIFLFGAVFNKCFIEARLQLQEISIAVSNSDASLLSRKYDDAFCDLVNYADEKRLNCYTDRGSFNSNNGSYAKCDIQVTLANVFTSGNKCDDKFFNPYCEIGLEMEGPRNVRSIEVDIQKWWKKGHGFNCEKALAKGIIASSDNFKDAMDTMVHTFFMPYADWRVISNAKFIANENHACDYNYHLSGLTDTLDVAKSNNAFRIKIWENDDNDYSHFNSGDDLVFDDEFTPSNEFINGDKLVEMATYTGKDPVEYLGDIKIQVVYERDCTNLVEDVADLTYLFLTQIPGISERITQLREGVKGKIADLRNKVDELKNKARDQIQHIKNDIVAEIHRRGYELNKKIREKLIKWTASTKLMKAIQIGKQIVDTVKKIEEIKREVEFVQEEIANLVATVKELKELINEIKNFD